MLSINQTLYERLGDLLIEAIDSRGFYSGDICIEEPEANYRFLATLLIHYTCETYPEGSIARITDLIPVWWEFHSLCDDGEHLNDFDFNTLKELICS